MKESSLHFRILAALNEFRDGRAGYHSIMRRVWPVAKFPRAYRHSTNGGPSGVAMAYGKALRELQDRGYISRMAIYIGGEEERFGQPDVLLLSAGRKALRER